MNTITALVISTKRVGTSRNGNPSYDVELGSPTLPTGLVFRTQSDSSLAYEIGNAEYRDEPHTFALTRTGRISHVIR